MIAGGASELAFHTIFFAPRTDSAHARMSNPQALNFAEVLASAAIIFFRAANRANAKPDARRRTNQAESGPCRFGENFAFAGP
jgi:hypothetical protein